MITEATSGSWSYEAIEIWKLVMWTLAIKQGEEYSKIANETYQSLSVILHRSNARAIMKRSPNVKKQDHNVESALLIIGEEDCTAI